MKLILRKEFMANTPDPDLNGSILPMVAIAIVAIGTKLILWKMAKDGIKYRTARLNEISKNYGKA